METPIQVKIGDSCKSFGKIERIEKIPINESCLYELNIKLSNNNKYYLFKATEENKNIEDKTLLNITFQCDGTGYTFSSGKIPKVGDTIYFTAEYGYNNIINVGKDVYNTNEDLPDCGQYFINIFDGSYNNPYNYEIMDICRISGKIENIIRIQDENGWSNSLNLKILSNNNEKFNLGASELILDNQGQSKVLGLNTIYPTNSSSGNGPSEIYFPTKGDNFYALLDKSSFQILKVGKENYDSYNGLVDCIGEKNMENTNSGTKIITQEKTIIQTKNNIKNKIEENSGILDEKVQTGNIDGSGNDISKNSFTGIINDIKPLENEKNLNYSFILLGTLFIILILFIIFKNVKK